MNSKVLFYWACSARFVIFFPNMIIFTCTVTKALWLIDRHSFSFQTGVGNFTFQSAYMSSSWFPKLLEITSSKFAACLQISSVRTFDELVCKPLTAGFCDFSDVTQGCKAYFVWCLAGAAREGSLLLGIPGQNCIIFPLQFSPTACCNPI